MISEDPLEIDENWMGWLLGIGVDKGYFDSFLYSPLHSNLSNVDCVANAREKPYK